MRTLIALSVVLTVDDQSNLRWRTTADAKSKDRAEHAGCGK
jgi:hypothetical protein